MISTRTLGTSAALAFLFAALLVVAALGSATVEAARGGGNKGGGSTPVLAVSPNPVPLGTQSIVISGSGFPANKTIWLDTGHMPQPTVDTDGSGAFSMVYYHEYGPGQAGVAAYLSSRKGMTFLTYTTFTICSTNPC